MNGVQYKSGQAHSATPNQTAILGALRGGGFANARIDTANAGRLTYWRTATDTSQLGVVPVRSSGQAVTSRHMNPTTPSEAIVWGSGALGTAGAGSSITMACTSCHNPHGNGQYRILDPRPGDGEGDFAEALVDAPVRDLLDPERLHNYTVIQKLSTTATFSSSGSVTADGAESGYLLYADQIDDEYTPAVGDYFHRNVPWNGANQFTDVDHPLVAGIVKNRMNDAPNGHPADSDASTTVDNSFDAQINAWCSQCHTRYLDGSSGAGQDTTGSWGVSSGDDIFNYRHSNSSNKPCTTCHVAHGSNAQMGGEYSSLFPYPDGTTSGSSRLLKFDNRGTCQACHDPTGSVDAGTWYPAAVPTPVVP